MRLLRFFAAILGKILRMTLTRASHCKINLLLDVLGKRPDGFHELETILSPVPICDQLEFATIPHPGVELSCSDSSLPTGRGNLVFDAATAFLKQTRLKSGIKIHLEKCLPIAAGLGGGSGNAAQTLTAMNEIFDRPLRGEELTELAATLGSDVPFFLQDAPALGTGRGERIVPLKPFPALRGAFVLLINLGFGVSTPWAYRQLNLPALTEPRRSSRSAALLELLSQADLDAVGPALFNSLEGPVFEKYPVLALLKEFLGQQGAKASLMCGSGSSTFAICESERQAQKLGDAVRAEFGQASWIGVAPM